MIGVGLGEALSLGSAAAWAIGVILYRQLVRQLPPLALNFTKNALVLLMLLPLPWLLHGPRWPSFSSGEILLTLGSGMLGIAVADTVYFVALARLGAARMGVLGNAYSPLVILLSVLLLGERLGPWQLAGFALVMAGVIVISRRPTTVKVAAAESMPQPGPPLPQDPPPSLSSAWGTLLGITSIALMAVAIVMIKPVLEAHPLGWVTLLRLVGALGGLLLVAILRGQLRQLSLRGRRVDWKRLLAAAFVGQLLSMVMWLGGYKYAPASIAAVLNETASLFIVLLAWFWLREPIGRQGLLGVGLTLSGVALMLLA